MTNVSEKYFVRGQIFILKTKIKVLTIDTGARCLINCIHVFHLDCLNKCVLIVRDGFNVSKVVLIELVWFRAWELESVYWAIQA